MYDVPDLSSLSPSSNVLAGMFNGSWMPSLGLSCSVLHWVPVLCASLRSCFFSSKHHLCIFALFLLYSRTVLHATKCISRVLVSCICGGSVGFWYVSVAIAKSLFRIRVLALLCVSIEIVVGVLSIMVPSGTIFHNGFNVPLGSGALLISVFWLLVFFI